jgi:tetratricopeptide (TPR) repeat protein
MDPASPDARLSNYRLERLLGQGGMGAVYLARDLALDRPVAIKFIAPDRAADPVARQRLLREARAAAALDHPNICVIHEVSDEPGGRACIVMQYVEGETLASRLRSGPLEVRLALAIAADLASALSLAHDHHIIHRDIKPQNIVLTRDNHAKLLDFGLALQGSAVGRDDETTAAILTTPGALAGTPAYMSPEQAQGLVLDGRSDLFSLGCVLFECLTGRRPFTGSTSFETAHNILTVDPPDPSSLRAELSEQQDELCRRLLAKHRDDRFQSAEELLGALRLSTSGSYSPRPAVGRPGESLAADAAATIRPQARRTVQPAMLAVVGALVAAAAALAGWVAWQADAPQPAEGTVIAILPVRNDTGDAANDPVAAGMTAALRKRLGAIRGLHLAPSEETHEAIREQDTRAVKAGRNGSALPDPAAVARELGAAFAVEGSLIGSAPRFEVETAVVEADGARYPVARLTGSRSIFDLHRQTADALVATLAQRGLVSDADLPITPPTANADAFAEYSQARVFLERPDVSGNLQHAITLLQGAIAKDPGFALAHAGLADAYWAQFQETQDPAWTSKAMAANIDALRIDPNQPEVRMSLARAYREQGEHEKAVEEIGRVMAVQPQNDGAHRALADILATRADWEAAVNEARQAIAIRPSYWRNHHQLGLVYFRAGKYAEATDAFTRVVQLQPDSARGYQSLGTALQAAGRNDEALKQYERANAISPSARSYSNVGTLYFWRGDYARAAEAYEKAVALLPNDPELFANLGDARAQLRQSSGAVEAYRTAADQVSRLLAVSPNDPHRLAALALYRAKLGERAAAQQTIRKAVSISPADGQVLYAAALVHSLLGDMSEACRVLTSAVAEGASSEEIRHAHELRALKGCAAYDSAMEGQR